MIAYKLIRKLKDGSLSPLFINKKMRIPIGVWMEAEEHKTKGFALRKGFHCTLKPIAPHLSTKNRVWVECEVEDTELYNRPESQGGTWVLAQRMKVIKEIYLKDMKELFQEQLNKNKPLSEEDITSLQRKTYFNGEKIKVGDIPLMAMLLGEQTVSDNGCSEAPITLVSLNENYFYLFESVNMFEGKTKLPVIKLKY